MSKLKKTIQLQINKFAKYIKNGGIVAFPTETVYGLGADVFNDAAVKKIFKVKKRPFYDPLIVHIADIRDINTIAFKPSKYGLKLIKHFWPGPLTVVLNSKNISKFVNNGGNTVAVRMPKNEIALEFIKKCGVPLAAPSANLFGKLSPVTPDQVKKQLGNKIDGIIDGGRCKIGIESTIVDVTGDKPIILRKGIITKEQIEEVAGVETKNSVCVEKKYPGNFRKHYSPETPLFLIKSDDIKNKIKNDCAYVFFNREGKFGKLKNKKNVYFLSKKGDIKEAAANLYFILYKIDVKNYKKIYVEYIKEKGIGQAIMDRIKRAAKINK